MKKLFLIFMLTCGTGWSRIICFDDRSGIQTCIDDLIPNIISISTRTATIVTSKEFDALKARVKALEDAQKESGRKTWEYRENPCPPNMKFYKNKEAQGCIAVN